MSGTQWCRGRTEGLYAEPAGAAPVAGVRTALARDIIETDETVVIITTGFGLKETVAPTKSVATRHALT